MPRVDWRVALRVSAGFLIGLAIWTLLSPQYDRVISRATEWIVRAAEDPAVTRLRPASDGRITIDRADFDPRSKRPAASVRDLTFNFVLLLALFGVAKRPFSDRNIGGFLAASAVLAVTHVLGFLARIMSIYTGRLGPWSQANYGDFTRQFWGVADHFYRLVLMYAIAFALWWVFRDTGEGKKQKAEGRRKK